MEWIDAHVSTPTKAWLIYAEKMWSEPFLVRGTCTGRTSWNPTVKSLFVVSRRIYKQHRLSATHLKGYTAVQSISQALVAAEMPLTNAVQEGYMPVMHTSGVKLPQPPT